jgi:hypothetical protein
MVCVLEMSVKKEKYYVCRKKFSGNIFVHVGEMNWQNFTYTPQENWASDAPGCQDSFWIDQQFISCSIL